MVVTSVEFQKRDEFFFADGAVFVGVQQRHKTIRVRVGGGHVHARIRFRRMVHHSFDFGLIHQPVLVRVKVAVHLKYVFGKKK